MSFEQKVSESKISKCGTFSTRTVKVGNKVLGIIEVPKRTPGSKPSAIYWASPDVIQESRGDAGSLMILRSGVQGLKPYGVSEIAVTYQDGTRYITSFEVVTDIRYLQTGGRYFKTPKTLWEETRPSEEMRVLMTLSKMRIAGEKRKSPVT